MIALEGASGGTVSPDGEAILVTANYDLARFTLHGAGGLTYVGCIGDLPGCSRVSPTEALGNAASVVASADGTQLYVAAGGADALDHLTVGRPPPAPRLPSNTFSFGKLKLNKRRGTATLVVRVPGPGSLLLSGAGVKTILEEGRAAAELTSPIDADGQGGGAAQADPQGHGRPRGHLHAHLRRSADATQDGRADRGVASGGAAEPVDGDERDDRLLSESKRISVCITHAPSGRSAIMVSAGRQAGWHDVA